MSEFVRALELRFLASFSEKISSTILFFFFSSRRRHTRSKRDWSSDVCSSDLPYHEPAIRQGVTTYIIGQDGVAMAPASPPVLDYMRRYTAGFNGNFPTPGLSRSEERRVGKECRSRWVASQEK